MSDMNKEQQYRLDVFGGAYYYNIVSLSYTMGMLPQFEDNEVSYVLKEVNEALKVNFSEDFLEAIIDGLIALHQCNPDPRDAADLN